MATVSVVMNCFNGEKYLCQALDSVFSQTYTDWEVIFWDNASTDSSGEIARSYGKRVKYYRSSETTSLGKARNEAFARAEGDYIAILDVDDLWLPTKLEQQIPLFEKDSEVALTFTDSTYFDEEGDQESSFQMVEPHRGYIFSHLIRQNFISTETMMFRRSSFEKLPRLFDERFTMVMDYDLSLRIVYENKADFIDACLSKWRMNPDSLSSRKWALFPRENLIMIKQLRDELLDIEDRDNKEIDAFEQRTRFRLGLVTWCEGNIADARTIFRHADKSRICKMALMSTWLFPFSMPYESLLKLRKMFHRVTRNSMKLFGGRH
jgi:glycosyltransferase involved in cell wall biosynthesis